LPVVADVTRGEVPRFPADESAGIIAQRLRESGQDWAAIVDAEGLLLGRVRLDRIADPSSIAADVMEEGPSTYRPNVPLQELLSRMEEKGFSKAFVTDPDGRLIGLIVREDIEAALNRPGIAASLGRSLQEE